MKKRLSILVLAALLSGCATYAPSVPKDYTGPTALLSDSADILSSSKADFYVAEQIDGSEVNNSISETFRKNQGRGMSMTPFFIHRPIIAGKPIRIAIKARTHYAAPIQALTSTVYQLTGVIEFTPKAEARYVVRGQLGEEYSSVWIEDSVGSQLVAPKIEKKGSSKLGVLQK